MAIFFTADFHLGDETLTSRKLRPFKSGSRMADVLIANANTRAKNQSDTIIHLGDFVAYGKDHGIESARISGVEYAKRFTADVVLVEGNHDPNNNVKAICRSMFLDIGQFKGISCSHFPSWYSQNEGVVSEIPGHIHLCGHVHDGWKTAVSKKGVLNINVGVDVWNYQIVSVQDIIKLLQKITGKI